MVMAELEGDEIVVHTELRDKDLIKQVPAARYDTQRYRWMVPVSWAACKTLRGLFGKRLEIGPGLKQWSWDEYNVKVKPALETRAALNPDEVPYYHDKLDELRALHSAQGRYQLYPHQGAGAIFLAITHKALITDEMGTGKTAMTISGLRLLHLSGWDIFPILIVCPNSMKRTWAREFEMWWPGLHVELLDGNQKQRVEKIQNVEHVLITNIEKVRLHSKQAAYGSIRLKGCHVCEPELSQEKHPQSRCQRCPKDMNKRVWRSIVIDEAHRMKDPKAQQTRAVWACATKDTEFRYALTGTPIANNPIDMWAALHFINIFGTERTTKSRYIDRWCYASLNPFGGLEVHGLNPDTLDEFFSIIDPRMRRVPKKAVLHDLPPKVYETRYIEMSPKQKRAYRQMEEHLIAQLEEGVLVATNPLTQLTRLSQFASAFAEINDEGRARLQLPSNKVDELIEFIDDLEPGTPFGVFAQSRQLIELAGEALEKKGVKVGYITGSYGSDARDGFIQDFQAGHIQAMLCTYAAGGVGITLTRANIMVKLQHSWSMVEERQAEDRFHRIGSEIHDQVLIIDFLSEETVDVRQKMVVGEKGELLEEITRDRKMLAEILGTEWKGAA
jgi:SNF2 family DNA or RNA helicase